MSASKRAAAYALLLMALSGVSDATAASLRTVGQSPSPAATDGNRFAAWVRPDGRLAIRDVVQRRTHATAVLCPPSSWEGVAPQVFAGSGRAVVRCPVRAVDGSGQWNVSLSSGTARVLAAPGLVSYVGRYWFAGEGSSVSPEVYVNRRTLQVKTYSGRPGPGLFDPDTPGLTHSIVPGDAVARLLLNGHPVGFSNASRLVVRDPRRRDAVTVVRACNDSCENVFGRIGRLVYVQRQAGQATVVLRERHRATQRWHPRLPSTGLSSYEEVFPQLTRRELVVSLAQADATYRITAARLK